MTQKKTNKDRVNRVSQTKADGRETASPEGEVASKGDVMAAARQTNGVAERWLQDQISRLYEEVLSEPLPSDLLDVIDRFQEKESLNSNTTKP